MANIDVLGQIYISFLHQLPVPKEVSAAFIEKFRKGNEGAIKSWDDVFGKPTRYGTGEKVRRRIEQEGKALKEAERLTSEGDSFNDEGYVTIGKRTGVGAKSKVKELLHDAREWAERLKFLYRRH